MQLISAITLLFAAAAALKNSSRTDAATVESIIENDDTNIVELVNATDHSGDGAFLPDKCEIKCGIRTYCKWYPYRYGCNSRGSFTWSKHNQACNDNCYCACDSI
ncbi:hypothetical protein N3K66_003741 [Trichothecium roseum]|uniref:Uncharacterized protein n=1 Tax=Trichothecium roseum TaxID=47278 RepID=A0ACC0V878_9HYPO|nr:hypothetical protein N3K66_003741 [Trichothecium roseum]